MSLCYVKAVPSSHLVGVPNRITILHNDVLRINYNNKRLLFCLNPFDGKLDSVLAYFVAKSKAGMQKETRCFCERAR